MNEVFMRKCLKDEETFLRYGTIDAKSKYRCHLQQQQFLRYGKVA